MNFNKETFRLIYVLKQLHPHTYAHSINVSNHSVVLGKKLNLNVHDLEILQFAGLFHDIGKLKIPESIWKKPGKLTDEEFEEMKRHPIYSVELLKTAGIVDVDVLKTILYHHERADGRGYPNGLPRNTIPYLSKIIAVTDSFDAMTSNRCYRKGLNLEQAKQELINGRGSQFDSEVVTAFLETLEEKEEKIVETVGER